MLDQWRIDIDDLKTEIRIQELMGEYFKTEMFRLLDLCLKNNINPKF